MVFLLVSCGFVKECVQKQRVKLLEILVRELHNLASSYSEQHDNEHLNYKIVISRSCYDYEPLLLHLHEALKRVKPGIAVECHRGQPAVDCLQ